MNFRGDVDPNDDSDAIQLQQVSIQATPDELKILADFLLDTARVMEKHGNAFRHEHFQYYCEDKKIRQPYEPPDLVICRY